MTGDELLTRLRERKAHHVGVSRVGGRLAALAELAPNWSATVSVTVQDLDDHAAQYVISGLAPLTRDARTQTPQDNQFVLVSAALKGDLSFATLRASAAYVRHDTDTIYDASDGLFRFAPGAGDATASYDEARRRRLVFAEAVLTSAGPSAWGWSTGVFLADAVTDTREAVGAGDGVGQVFREDRVDRVNEEALFGEVAYSPNPVSPRELGSESSMTA